jgi:glycerate 2-kinase
MRANRDRLAVEMRVTARHLFEYALKQCSIGRAFARHVSCERGVLRIGEDLYNLNSYSRLLVVSIGKAAHALVNALEMQAGERFEGIVASSTEPAWQAKGFRYFRGGHPVPNHESLRAADAMLRSLAAQNSSSLVIYLLSGGGSSIVEKPLDDEISLADLVAAYGALVHSGAPISEINAIRKHLSAVKGGKLACAAYPAQQVSILVSDVPDQTPDALASGPTPSVRELFERRALDETPKSDHPAFLGSRWWTVLSNASLLEAVRPEAERHGFLVEVDNTCDDWDYIPASEYLLGRLRHLRNKAARVCLISGGEVTVKVTHGGTGGRNQQFALACVEKIADQSITILSAGTDGIDGNSPAAGAVVDGTTLTRASVYGMDAKAFLREFDAYVYFEKLGDAVVTGPTGNNLRDLRILLAYEPFPAPI